MEDPPPSSEVPAAVAAADSKPQLNGPSEQDTQELVVWVFFSDKLLCTFDF